MGLTRYLILALVAGAFAGKTLNFYFRVVFVDFGFLFVGLIDRYVVWSPTLSFCISFEGGHNMFIV